MSAGKALAVAAALALALLGAARLKAQPQDPMAQHNHAMGAAEADKKVEQGAVNAMTPAHHHAGLHMRMTQPRPQTSEDLARADAVAKTLRAALERYKDYRVAIADGYRPFLPNIPQPQYHFTNSWHGFLEAFAFDPARPSSLLYRKTRDGYELIGAMYTMPKNATEDQLNQRVPLSVATWHLHVNLCMPPAAPALSAAERAAQGAHADWTRFGLAGSIATPDACAAAGGTFRPSVFGWMVHVYPFETSPDKIWRH